MKKLILVVVLIIAILNYLYTFGYQGEPMSQLEFLNRTFGSLAFGLASILLLKMKKLILLSSVLLVVSCNDRPDCTNTNEIFNKYSPNIKEYKDELVNQLRLVDNTKLKYWIKEYVVIEEEEFIYLYIQGDGLCAIIEINTNPEKIKKETGLTYNGFVPLHTEIGPTHTGIEFMNLTFNIKQDSLNTEFIFRDYERRGFD